MSGPATSAPAARPLAIVLLGPPASGKTTAVRGLLAEPPATGTAHFKVRGHLALLVSEGDRIAVPYRERLRRREVLPDPVVRHSFADFVRRTAPAPVVLVEGYPKSPAQLADLRGVLDAAGGRLGGAIVIDAPDPVIRARAGRRLACPDCDVSAAAGERASCPDCGAPMLPRADDRQVRLDARIAQFRSSGRFLWEARDAPVPVETLDGRLPPQALTDRLRDAVRRLTGPHSGRITVP
ncbi:hypothetical protein [Streptomyces sp. A0592]|uniref:hypothetical protein n=1 Tax=Streptomyces sp. A0592 TaxID=2563099 RepID=UPI00109E77FD|nr:hypothetical protein [Streptomyces sp. A0592]THA80315.1 hypothetical protein E6U81_29555 [Streptomyces sp. A0592]